MAINEKMYPKSFGGAIAPPKDLGYIFHLMTMTNIGAMAIKFVCDITYVSLIYEIH